MISLFLFFKPYTLGIFLLCYETGQNLWETVTEVMMGHPCLVSDVEGKAFGVWSLSEKEEGR